eukprot:TRINITY_DN2049_c1_g1_i1.p1 TRINITY_DN2049_c1_g1~~TRINITY_DN2049_c1_g1_i1.p1  ORF type:complete len:359 (-),score=132.58 TRINITY_DN2049_c1_g1_i1:399-1475(-)
MSTTSSSSSSSSSSSRTSNHDTPLPRLDHCRAPASYFLDHPTTTTTTITTTSTSSSLSASPKTASAAEPGTAPTSTLSDIPSISSGVRTLAEEKERRRECIGRIHETCVRLQVPQQVTSTACVLFHRLYIRQCLPGEVGSTMLNEISCVYLSTKLEEHPRKMRDVINCLFRIHNPREEPLSIGNDYWQLRDAVVEQEQKVLRALSYDLHVEHPHKHLLNYVKSLQASSTLTQVALSLLDDTYYSLLPITARPHVLACACIAFASRLVGEAVRTCADVPWWAVFDVSTDQIEVVIVDLIVLYGDGGGSSSGDGDDGDGGDGGGDGDDGGADDGDDGDVGADGGGDGDGDDDDDDNAISM